MDTAVATSPKVSLLRPDQIEEMTGEREVLQRKMTNPNIQDKGVVAEQLRRLDTQLETQRPRAFGSAEIDNAVKREKELRAQWTQGMLSAEEMRKCPPGAVDRHLAWERKNKPAISEWQNLVRRLNAGSDAREVASIEMHRPATSMNLHNSLIEGKNYFLPPEGAATPVVFTAAQIEMLRALDPALADKIGLLNNLQRAEVKDVLTRTPDPVLSAAGKAGSEKKAWNQMNKAERAAHKAKKAA